MPYEEDKFMSCPYGEVDCNEDDYESMCHGCKEDRAESLSEARNDTYG